MAEAAAEEKEEDTHSTRAVTELKLENTDKKRFF